METEAYMWWANESLIKHRNRLEEIKTSKKYLIDQSVPESFANRPQAGFSKKSTSQSINHFYQIVNAERIDYENKKLLDQITDIKLHRKAIDNDTNREALEVAEVRNKMRRLGRVKELERITEDNYVKYILIVEINE